MSVLKLFTEYDLDIIVEYRDNHYYEETPHKP